MHDAHPIFLEALHSKHRLCVCFFHKKEGVEVTRVCAPLDYGPLRGAKHVADVYQLWDLEAKRKPYNLAVAPDDVRSLKALPDTFDLTSIITWTFKPHAWHIKRDWGDFS
jgi:hypothetical protein